MLLLYYYGFSMLMLRARYTLRHADMNEINHHRYAMMQFIAMLMPCCFRYAIDYRFMSLMLLPCCCRCFSCLRLLPLFITRQYAVMLAPLYYIFAITLR